jgi:hypothetical protein
MKAPMIPIARRPKYFQIDGTVSDDADGAVHPDKEDCGHHRNADGGSVRGSVRFPRYEFIRKHCAV